MIVGPNITVAKPRKVKLGDRKKMQPLIEQVAAGNCILHRKRNGACSLWVTEENTGDFWSRNQSSVTGEQICYSQKMQAPRKSMLRLRLPGGTILVGEAVLMDRHGREYPHRLTGILNSKPAHAIDLQEEHGLVRYVIFDVIAIEGQWVFDWPKWKRMAWLVKHFGKQIERLPLIGICRHYRVRSLKQLLGIGSRKGWEGVVIWLRDAPTIVRPANARTPRPKGIVALKFLVSEDFAVIGWTAGPTGKKILRLARADQHGLLVATGKVSNLSTRAIDILEAQQLPFVVEVLCESIGTNGIPQQPALKLDKHTRDPIIRHDKNPEECTIFL